ncbi:DUF2252 domain-containing protein [Marinobacterium jannaschii]|uniref:DUF2252 domain-containing protein n=1 Tax=Marinobacterium jannaschii TaxID=64970 RepID=UPI0004890A00|nr:DUF2252 family protein [Marinobacterium jannaschii]
MKVLDTRARRVVDEISRFNQDLPADARALKYSKMAASPFVFFRGTSHLYWLDVSRDWRISLFGGRPASQVWLQGDAHVYNFGALHDHEDRIYFGMDDFDDAVVGDYQFDLWRLAASMVLDLSERPFFSENLADRAVKALGKAYIDAVVKADGDNPALRLEHAPEPIRSFLQKVHRKNSREKMLDKWTSDDASRLNLEHDKLEQLSDQASQKLSQALSEYFKTCRVDTSKNLPVILDLAQRTQAGTGSLGTDRYYALIAGDCAGENLILDIKQQREPASVAVMPDAEQHWYRSNFTNEGRRHAQAYRAIAEHPDRWLGWMEMDGLSFSVRERSPFKKDFPTHQLSIDEYVNMAEIWGEILGREHARGSWQVQEPQNRFIAYIRDEVETDRKAFIRTLRAVSLNYARCVKQDWATFNLLLAPES